MTANTKYEVGTVAHVAPDSLLLRKNIREAKPDADLVASVKDSGVLVPITAALTPDGSLIVRTGHRRTIAAIEAGCETVPVYIAGTDSDEATDEAARIIGQRDENTHRAGLTTGEEIAVVEQLAGLGLSAAQIAKQARLGRDHVKNALVASGSDMAREHAKMHTMLTLDQAAALAEFEDDPEAIIALVNASAQGKFDHAVQRLRDDRLREARREAIRSEAEAAGLKVVERPLYDDKTTKPLHQLSASTEDRTPLDEGTGHTECPGHVVWVDLDWISIGANGEPIQVPDEPDEDADEAAWNAYDDECRKAESQSRKVQLPVLVTGCADWLAQGHNDLYSLSGTSSAPKKRAAEMTEEERAAAKAARALVIENNKAWSAATPVRRKFLADLAKAKTPPKGTARFLAAALGSDAHLLGSVGANHFAASLLGKKDIPAYGYANLTPAKTATDAKCLIQALISVLAAYEDNLTDSTWRENGETNQCGRYLRFLSERCDYALSDVETYAISSETV